MCIKLCLGAFLLGVLVEAKPLRLASRLTVLIRAGVQKVSEKLVANVDEKLDDKLGEDDPNDD